MQIGAENLDLNMQQSNTRQLNQQQPYFGAHLSMPRSNLGNLGPNLAQKHSNLVPENIDIVQLGYNLGNQISNHCLIWASNKCKKCFLTI